MLACCPKHCEIQFDNIVITFYSLNNCPQNIFFVNSHWLKKTVKHLWTIFSIENDLRQRKSILQRIHTLWLSDFIQSIIKIQQRIHQFRIIQPTRIVCLVSNLFTLWNKISSKGSHFWISKKFFSLFW